MNKYLLAVSGGADSIYLLQKFIKENRDFVVVHINHNTRGKEHIKDKEAIASLLSNKYDLCEYSYKHKSGNFQSQARNYRLKVYKELIFKYNLEAVVTGHNFDDQIENILMSQDKISPCLMQETSYLDGIKILRPLLNIYKEEIKEYLHKHNITYNEDISNSDNTYKRNNIRNNILSNYTRKQKEELFNQQIAYEKLFNSIKVEQDFILKEQLLGKNKNELYIYLYKLLKRDNAYNIKRVVLDNIINLLDSNGNKQIKYNKDKYLNIVYDKIYINLSDKFVDKQPLKLGLNNFNGIEFNSNKEDYFIRVKRDGDRVFNQNNSKLVSRLFIDNKVDKFIRDKYPIIVDNCDNIVCIPFIWRDNEITK